MSKDFKLIAFRGKARTLRSWVLHTGLKIATIQTRLKRGWTIEQTLTEPRDESRVRKEIR